MRPARPPSTLRLRCSRSPRPRPGPPRPAPLRPPPPRSDRATPVHRQRAPTQSGPIELSDSGCRILVVCHLHEAKSPAPPRFPVHHHIRRDDRPHCLKRLPKLRRARIKGKTTHEQPSCHLRLLSRPITLDADGKPAPMRTALSACDCPQTTGDPAYPHYTHLRCARMQQATLHRLLLSFAAATSQLTGRPVAGTGGPASLPLRARHSAVATPVRLAHSISRPG